MLGTYRPYAELVLCALSAGAARIGTIQFERMARNWTALKDASIRIRKTAVDATIEARYAPFTLSVNAQNLPNRYSQDIMIILMLF